MTFSSTGKPITRIALAPAAVIECAAPRRNVAMPPGVSRPAAARVVGDAPIMISQASAPPTVAHRNPTRPQPISTVAVATATRMTASVTISAPYCVQRLVPASMPSRVACRQNPASPTLSRPTESQWACANTRPLHSGELPAITTAAPSPTMAATRSGCVRASGSTSA